MTTAPKKQPIPFGKYLLLDRINIGGMAEVWRGKMFGAGGFERLVAIKRILPSIAEDEEFITMFIDEAKISVQLTHANIAQIHELGNIQNSYFIAMEYIPGKDMRAIFERCRKKGEPAPIPLSCYVIAKLCEGLDYAHRKKDGMGRDMNVVHRDVSPQNVLVSYEGEVKVIDFGIAKAAGKATKTQAGILKGKFGYMSPEQIRGLPLDRRSDVFAIGVCLYEMLTGERLFVGDSDFSVLEKVRKVDILPPTTYNRRIPEALEKIVLKALAKDVDVRYQYANELADDLQRFLITSDSIFSRKDLMAYMKATFAEEVEREKVRIQEYTEVKAPEGMAAAADMGFGAPLPALSPRTSPSMVAPPVSSGGAPAPKRTSSLAALPRLTPAAPVPQNVLDQEEGATVVASGPGIDKPAEDGPSTDPGEADVGEATPPLEDEDATAARPLPLGGPARPPPPVLGGAPAARVSSVTAVPPGARKETPPRASRPVPRVAPEPSDEGELPSEPPRRGVPMKWIIAGASAVALVIVATLIFVLRQPAEGFLVVDIPGNAAARATARLNVGGKDLGVPSSWPYLHKSPAGSTPVMVIAEGHRPFMATVDVQEGARPTTVNVELEPLVRTAELLVLTSPEDAEVRLNGEVVKATGSTEVYAGKVALGAEQVVEVSRAGYRTETQRFTADAAGNTRRLAFTLEKLQYPVTVTSEPAGATILANGRQVGVTPANLTVEGDVRSLTLTKRCFTPAEVPLSLPAQPAGSPIPVKGALTRQPNCR